MQVVAEEKKVHIDTVNPFSLSLLVDEVLLSSAVRTTLFLHTTHSL